MTIPEMERWVLPDGVDELLPDAAWRVETLRRLFMDHCHRWGYELVMPPLVEFLDSLLTGTGETLDLQTFKLVDQHNGRSLGVRADITPQVARIDAHALRRDRPNRLFYIGTVLRARSDGFGGNRAPQQLGAELFGYAGAASDVEIIRLMLETVLLTGLAPASLVLDLGHVGVYRALVQACGLDDKAEAQVFDAMQRGSNPDLRQVLDEAGCDSAAADALAGLSALAGSTEAVSRAREQIGSANETIAQALDTLEAVIAAINSSHPDVDLHVDLAELRGYRYHTGTLFSLYTRDGEELARGGRYDAIGKAFGRARPATGFSSELKRLADHLPPNVPVEGIHVPDGSDPAVFTEIQRLRVLGNRVVPSLPGTEDTGRDHGCDRELVRSDKGWMVRPLKQ